jgi:hypothetical protein
LTGFGPKPLRHGSTGTGSRTDGPCT